MSNQSNSDDEVLARLIREAGREPVERDTAYRRVERKDETSFAILV